MFIEILNNNFPVYYWHCCIFYLEFSNYY